MDSDQHAPFRRGGDDVPVRYVVAPAPEATVVVPPGHGRRRDHRLLAIVTAALLVTAVVAAGNAWLRGVPVPQGPPLLAGLDAPPAVDRADSVHAFLATEELDVVAEVQRARGNRRVLVTATERMTGEQRWEQTLEFAGAVGSVGLWDTHADGSLTLTATGPARSRIISESPAQQTVQLMLPPTYTLVTLALDTGFDRGRVAWASHTTPLASADGRLYQWDDEAGELVAWADPDSERWRSPLDVEVTASSRIREHAGWLLMVPGDDERRARHRGSDVFFAALDPSTGARPDWWQPLEHQQYLILEDIFVQFTTNTGERAVRARSWEDGERRWHRFVEGVIPVAVDGNLFFTDTHEAGTRLIAVDSNDGGARWQLDVDGTIGLLMRTGDELLVAIREDHALRMVDLATGEPLRNRSYAPPDSSGGVQLDDRELPYLGADKVFVASEHDFDHVRLTARSLEDGRELWSRAYPGFQAVQQRGGRLLLLDRNSGRVIVL